MKRDPVHSYRCEAYTETGSQCRGHVTYGRGPDCERIAVSRAHRSVGTTGRWLCRTHVRMWDVGDSVFFADGRYKRGRIEPLGPLPVRRHTRVYSTVKATEAANEKRLPVFDLSNEAVQRVIAFYAKAYADGLLWTPRESAERLREAGVDVSHSYVCRIISAHADWFFGTVRMSDRGFQAWREWQEKAERKAG